MVYLRYESPVSQETDPFNVSMKRTIRNTNKRAYNCAGYALECFSWYCPKFSDWHDFSFDDEQEAEEKTAECINVMLQDFPTLRVVQTLADVRFDEYAILFRLSSTGDFHYLKRDKNNHWRHKMGNCKYIDTMPVEDIFKTWNLTWCSYNGPIVIFAKRREKL